MTKTLRGSRDAEVRTLYERERGRLFRVALRVGGGRRAFAEDVVQDVFVQLLSRYDDLDPDRELGGWLYRCVMNGCLTRLRRESVRQNPLVTLLLGDSAPEPPSPDVTVRLDALQREALDALSALSPRERVAFCMVRIDEAPLVDVAAVLSCSISTACKLAQKAERSLARRGWRTGSVERAGRKPWTPTPVVPHE
jgi:RNA polymerase sigma-70 factor (ECF subfamily)